MATVEEQIAAIQSRILDCEKKLSDLSGMDYSKMEKEIVRLNEVSKGLMDRLSLPPKKEPPTEEKDPLAALIDGD